MSFTRALYYPTIDISNDGWAKSAALFWDGIQTIVPQSFNDPYKNRLSKTLQDEGILTPLRVNPDMELVESLSHDVAKYLQTNEGFGLLIKGKVNNRRIHREKLPRELGRLIGVYPEKIPYIVQQMLREQFDRNDWVPMDGRFARYYMSLLANSICERDRLVLLTDDILASDLVQKAKVDNHIIINPTDEYRYRYGEDYRATLNLSEGIIANLAFEGIQFSPDVDILDIIKFKRKYKDELGRFRENLSKLAQGVSKNMNYEQIQAYSRDIYINQFEPSYNDLKQALNGYKIQWIPDNLMKISFFSTSATALPTYLLGASVPVALMIGAGISVVASMISYNQQRTEKLKSNPYSYLYHANTELSKEDFSKALRRRIV
jgi:hypothetical protein